MSVFVTGDVHGYPKRFDQPNLEALGLSLTKNDKVIICGDFGLPWYGDKEDECCLNWLATKPFEIFLYIQSPLLTPLPGELEYMDNLNFP